METKHYPYKVGDIVVPADGSRYRGVITYISKEEDTVRHRCTETGKEWEQSYWGFTTRYMTPEEFAAAEARREAHCPFDEEVQSSPSTWYTRTMDAKHIADLLTHLANATRRGELHHDAATAHEAALWELAHRKGLREEVAEILEENS